jgi:hypothetical protein
MREVSALPEEWKIHLDGGSIPWVKPRALRQEYSIGDILVKEIGFWRAYKLLLKRKLQDVNFDRFMVNVRDVYAIAMRRQMTPK